LKNSHEIAHTLLPGQGPTALLIEEFHYRQDPNLKPVELAVIVQAELTECLGRDLLNK
jgi:hypothetical protein